MLFRTPSLGTAEERVLNQIRQLWQETSLSLEKRPRRWTGLLARNLRARAIQGSNSIEGYVVSQEAALAALDGDKPEDTDETAWINVVRYREAMDYVLQLVNDDEFSYTPTAIKSIHFMMMRHRPDKNPGLWRPGTIYVRNDATGETVYEGPPADSVSKLVQELCSELTALDNDTPTRLVRAAMAHLNLAMIHPFSDGNGRMSRCLQTLVLARGGVLDPAFSSIEEYLGRNHLAYYGVLADVGRGTWRPRNDARPWVRFCFTAHFRQAMSVKRRLERVAILFEEVERELARRSLPERAAVSLVNAALGYSIRNESYRGEADITVKTATRDLQELCAAHLIVPRGEKRGRHYVAGPWLAEIATRYSKRKPIPDPFDATKPSP